MGVENTEYGADQNPDTGRTGSSTQKTRNVYRKYLQQRTSSPGI